ncbi:MAG: hypothetical protein K8F91_05405, partial [Candidatus Obscuribacterales bacterium]|nr:hypothetical protein [Candidatus Obscuribacterales bacterium]
MKAQTTELEQSAGTAKSKNQVELKAEQPEFVTNPLDEKEQQEEILAYKQTAGCLETIHAVAGRIRLKTNNVKWNSAKSGLLVELLSGFDAISQARINTWNNNLIVSYTSALSEDEVLSIVENAIFRVENGLSKPSLTIVPVHIGLFKTGIGLLFERFPLLSRLVYGSARVVRAGLKVLDKLLPPAIQLSLGLAAFTAS